MSIFVILAGAFSTAGAAFDWDFFMNNRKARLFVKILGRNGARVFYGVLGAILMGLGGALAIGVV